MKQASMPAQSIQLPYSRSSAKYSGSSKNDGNSSDSEEKVVGHCAIALEQLCKVALAGSTSTPSVSVNAARILVNRGRPMHSIDTKSMQVLYSFSSYILFFFLF